MKRSLRTGASEQVDRLNIDFGSQLVFQSLAVVGTESSRRGTLRSLEWTR